MCTLRTGSGCCTGSPAPWPSSTSTYARRESRRSVPRSSTRSTCATSGAASSSIPTRSASSSGPLSTVLDRARVLRAYGDGDHGPDPLQHGVRRGTGLELQQNEQDAAERLEAAERRERPAGRVEQLLQQLSRPGVIGLRRADVEGHERDGIRRVLVELPSLDSSHVALLRWIRDGPRLMRCSERHEQAVVGVEYLQAASVLADHTGSGETRPRFDPGDVTPAQENNP